MYKNTYFPAVFGSDGVKLFFPRVKKLLGSYTPYPPPPSPFSPAPIQPPSTVPGTASIEKGPFVTPIWNVEWECKRVNISV